MLEHGPFGAMGGMLTTVRDLSRWVSMFLSAWPPRDGPETAPIRRSSLREMQQAWSPSATRVTRDPATGAIRLAASSYAFGLGVTQTCDFNVSVAHSGGLPGFGSVMRWLPDYGVGIIAFGNLTYTGWGGTASDIIDALAKTGALQPRPVEASPQLIAARDAVSKLVVRWDDQLADSIAAENLFLDRSKDKRRAELDGLRTQVGACSAPDRFDSIENALRGRWTMKCERGALEATITLAPTMPPTVQFLELHEAPGDTMLPTCPR
jgi:hypothetical protein